MIPSFCGDGMAIALESARRAADTLLAGRPAQDGKAFAAQIRTATLLAQAVRHPALQGALAGACRAVPAVLQAVALATRIRPDPA